MKFFLKQVIQAKLKYLAKIYLWRFKPLVIVVAGTTNRHWIKEYIIKSMRERGLACRGNRKNFNAEIGLPLSILGLAPEDRENNKLRRWIKIFLQAFRVSFFKTVNQETLILEMAIDRPDDIRYLLGIVKPDIAIFTSITMIYPENFSGLDEIAAEYRKLARSLPEDGLAVLNADDERISKLKEAARCRVLTYGIKNKDAGYQATDIVRQLTGQEFKIRTQDMEIKTVRINRFGQHHIYADLAKEIILKNI